MPDKETVRRLVRQAKRRYTAADLQAMSAEKMARLEAHPRFRAARTLLLYHSLPDEPCTHELLVRHGRGKTIYLPVVAGEDLLLRRYEGGDALREGAFRILEPSGTDFTDYASLHLAVVPGVAFDAVGRRVGRGKGYYDRLLSHSAFSQVYKLGICFDFQKFDTVPAAPFDVSMDEVL